MEKQLSIFYKRTPRIIISFICLLFSTPFIHAQSPVPNDAKLEKIAGGFQFVEGPLWSDSLSLLFSDVNGNTIYRWTALGGSTAYVKSSGGANGLTLDQQGMLVMAQQNARTVSRLEKNGTLTVIASKYNGKKLNSPNDIVLKSDGSLFFTDPPYGISSSQEELGFYGIYRLKPNGELQLLDKSLRRPNGLTLSPDEKNLYVGDSEANKIFLFDVTDDTTLTNKRQFAAMTSNGYTDGMKISPAGYLFATGPLGVWVYAKTGKLLDTILVPGQVSNCNWGDSDWQTLYITSGTNVYKIRIGPGATGVEMQKESNSPLQRFELLPNYPNPFNPTTLIRYKLNSVEKVNVSVFSVSGAKIITLVNGIENPGLHEVSFDGSSLSSGVYFCKVQCGDIGKTQKLVLTK